MKRPARLIAAGAAAFLLFLIALLPATLLLRFLPPDVTLVSPGGTVWLGQAANVTYRGRSLGPISWSNRPWRLALLELDYAVEIAPEGGSLSLDVRAKPSGRVILRNVRGAIPVATFDGLFAPSGWTGSAELDVARLVLVEGFPEEAEGVVIARNLRAPGVRGANIGSFELTLGAGSVGGEGISGRLRNLEEDGPLTVRATLELKLDRSYLLSGEVAAGPEASAAISRTLSFLGPPDSVGRRPFTVEGTL